jgi:hypothetical protein
MCMRFRNSCCYFGLRDFLTPKFVIPSGGEELDASCTCHPERPLEPRWRGESRVEGPAFCQAWFEPLCKGSDGEGNSRSFDSGKELASEFLRSAQDDNSEFGFSVPAQDDRPRI